MTEPTTSGLYWALIAGEWEPVRVEFGYFGYKSDGSGELEEPAVHCISSSQPAMMSEPIFWEWGPRLFPVVGSSRNLWQLQRERGECSKCSYPDGDLPAVWCDEHTIEVWSQ